MRRWHACAATWTTAPAVLWRAMCPFVLCARSEPCLTGIAAIASCRHDRATRLPCTTSSSVLSIAPASDTRRDDRGSCHVPARATQCRMHAWTLVAFVARARHVTRQLLVHLYGYFKNMARYSCKYHTTQLTGRSALKRYKNLYLVCSITHSASAVTDPALTLRSARSVSAQ